MYQIRLAESVRDDLKRVPAHYRCIILDAMEAHLSRNPEQGTRRKKMLVSLVPNFEARTPVWQLRVGDYRVFYDVDQAEKIVYVRLVRKKPAPGSTEEIL